MSKHCKRHPLYNIWRGMKRRCHLPTHPDFYLYGARGITVCDEWRASIAQFAADVGERPSPFHTLDRIDSTKGYEPNNVRWATRQEQQWARTTLPRIKINGEALTVAEWAARSGLPRDLIHGRRKMGWPVERLLEPRK